jgi:hypothetical protein
MRLKRAQHPNDTDAVLRYQRKADQEWDMAGLARADGDHTDAQRHTDQAREYERLAVEARGGAV